MNSPALIIIATVATLTFTGCTRNEEGQEAMQANSITIAAGSAEELCFDAKKDDELIFRFEADQSLEFNLHFHTDEQTYYPIVAHATAAEKGQYLVPKTDTYCLMWKNNHDVAVNLSAYVEGIGNIS